MNLQGLMKKETIRRVTIIESLYYSESFLSSDQLIDQLDCSLPALINDIRYLNNDDTPLQIRKHKGLYHLDFDPGSSIDTYYAGVLNKVLEFQILEGLFFERLTCIQKFSAQLNCSFSNLQRYLKKIDSGIQQWDFHIYHRPLRIEGNEEMIRQFYYLFFKEKRMPFKNYGFSERLLQGVDKFIHLLMQENNVTNNMNTHFQLLHHFLIALHRITKEHHLDTHLPNSSAVKLGSEIDQFNLRCLIERELKIPFTDQLMKECLWPLLSDKIVLNAEQQNTQRNKNLYLAAFYHTHRELVSRVNEELGYTLSESEVSEALRILGNDIYFFYPNREPISILAAPKKYMITLLRMKYSRAISKIERIVQTFLDTSHLPYTQERKDIYCCSLIIGIPHLLERLTVREKPLKVLLLSDASPKHEVLWGSILENFIKAPLHYEYFETPFLEPEKLAAVANKYDLIITDVTMPKLDTNTAIIAVNSCPTPQDLVAIQQFFDNIAPVEQCQLERYA
ncbi:hypothetical protein NRIC_34080 [Enterococcus florum]|uniref:Mga helix-turn-helix domain-containing protein n=1 Tax=Enterococcus florum TaxID=2480627 RepID=A0A4P5PBI2_9ENTE|nr:helix-turn-helix domain-containing protein [Enterococcus florum]GCF95517.1 hypothetical protein NRIC_34080 [Enterococcus florum]